MDYIPVSKVLNHFIVVDDDKTFITARELHIGIPTWCLALVWLAWIPAKAGALLCAWGSWPGAAGFTGGKGLGYFYQDPSSIQAHSRSGQSLSAPQLFL